MRNAAALMLIVGCATEATAQTPSPIRQCTGDQYRHLDFWVGEWDLEFRQMDGTTGHAKNVVKKDELGSCVISEHFEMPGFRGKSYSIYDRASRVWRQMWVDDQGGSFVLVGRPVRDQTHRFEFVTTTPVGNPMVLKRMIWEEVTPDSLTWRWQAQQADKSWKDLWVLFYRRSKANRNP